jgi:hypothetical protein
MRSERIHSLTFIAATVFGFLPVPDEMYEKKEAIAGAEAH